jgi:hypothetical protein
LRSDDLIEYRAAAGRQLCPPCYFDTKY